MSEKKTKDTRTRNWAIILYPDSAPANWRSIIDDMHIEWVESPLHDKDVNGDEHDKKAHWHIMLMFGGVKTYDQIRELTEPLNCPSPQKCQSAKGMVRYMAHLDNPEKYQYGTADIIAHGGVDIADLLKPTSSERYDCIRSMMEFVRSERITEFQDLMDYASVNRFEDWFPLLCDSSAIVMINYIKSIRHRSTKSMDYATGEVVE